MAPDPAALRNLVAILKSDGESIERLSQTADRFAVGVSISHPDEESIWAPAMALHHLYNAFEHAFERIARTMDEWVADQPRWHRSLLEQMLLAIPDVRPALFPTERRRVFEELLAFRHFVRHAHDAALDPPQLLAVLTTWHEHRGPVQHELARFIAFVEDRAQRRGVE